jgi:GH25 family lysozyme M1 (1,4-beta-N-acetylmuramidase)
MLQAWLEAVQQAFSLPPIIYTSLSAWAAMTGNPVAVGDRFSRYRLWLAWYPKLEDSLIGQFPASRVPAGWRVDDVAFWQYTSGGQPWYKPVPGVVGACDRDIHLGGL